MHRRAAPIPDFADAAPSPPWRGFAAVGDRRRNL